MPVTSTPPLPPVQVQAVPQAIPQTPLPPGIPTTPPITQTPPEKVTPIPTEQLKGEGIINLKADRQRFDDERKVFVAEGNVRMTFRGSLLIADRLRVNLLNRYALAEGNVTLTQGKQILKGDRFEYNFVQGEGQIRGAKGDIDLATLGVAQPDPVQLPLPTDISATTNAATPVGELVYGSQPAQGVQATGSQVGISLGSRRNAGRAPGSSFGVQSGSIRQLRFEAESADFYPEGWVARNIRITNDPFSPPELELRARQAKFTKLSPLKDEIRAEKPQLVFDQGFKLPLLRNRVIIDRTERPPGILRFGFDSEDRGGLFVEQSRDLLAGPVQLSITPQFYAQRAIQKGFNADAFGLKAKLVAPLGLRGSIRGRAELTTLDFAKLDDRFRGSLRAQQLIGTHTLSAEASYRDRLFNNSLGFQDVQSSLGLLFFSPGIQLGNSGISLSYQVGYQYITANTDRLDLLDAVRPNDRISLGRWQASVALNKAFTLWQGKPLPATATQGLRYTSVPVVPYLALAVGATGVVNGYSRGGSQNNLSLSTSVLGQFGHSAKDFLDYTAFNVTYSQVLPDGLSPFLFDRAVDTKTLSAGISQQIYGPFRLGFQTLVNLDTRREISTDYILEYSRRSYSLLLRYNPALQLGSIGFRVNEFNWTGGSETFGGSGVSPITNGVQRQSE
jgi:hypothetical protein